MFRHTICSFKNNQRELFILHGLHLIGCQFQTTLKEGGNIEVDGYVTATHTGGSFSIIGNKGYSRSMHEIFLFTGDDELVSYKTYMEIYYPAYRHIWLKHLPKLPKQTKE